MNDNLHATLTLGLLIAGGGILGYIKTNSADLTEKVDGMTAGLLIGVTILGIYYWTIGSLIKRIDRVKKKEDESYITHPICGFLIEYSPVITTPITMTVASLWI